MGALALRRINLGYFAHFGAGGRSRAVRTHAAAQDSVSEECSSLASQKSINRTYVSTALQQTMERIHSKSQGRPHRTDTRHTAPIMCSAARGACGMRR